MENNNQEVTQDTNVSAVQSGSVVQSSGQTPVGRGSNKKKLIIGGMLMFVVLVGGAFAATYTYLNSKPEKVLADAFVNTMGDLVDKKPMSSVAALSFESKGDTAVKLEVKLDGKSNGKDSQGSADITINFGGKRYSVKASSVVVGEDEFYVKVERLREAVRSLTAGQPALAAYEEMVEPIIAKIDNKWIKITKNDLTELGVADEETVDKCSNAVRSIELSKKDRKQLKKLFNENQFIVAGETLSTESVSGEKSFHYKLDFNDKAAESFAHEVIAMDSLARLKKDCDIDEKDIKDTFAKEEGRVGSDVKPVVELWVGKKSRRPTQFKITAKDTEFSMDLNTQVTFNADNIVVKKPANSISVQELKKEFESLVPTGL